MVHSLFGARQLAILRLCGTFGAGEDKACGTGYRRVSAGVAPPCGRACLARLVNRYLEALVRRDAGGLPLNRYV